MVTHGQNGGDGSRRGLERRLLRALPFLGPAFIAAVAYIDPGNYATNIQAGARCGEALLWVVVASNAMAMLIQHLSAKLGLVTRRNLAEWCRASYRPWVARGIWFTAVVSAMATDLAEFLGAALGFRLLLGWPLWLGGLGCALVTLALLGLERRGYRPLELVIGGFVGFIALCYVAELFWSRPDWHRLAGQMVRPTLPDAEAALLACGILGATVMPHVIYLHSALTQHRTPPASPAATRRQLRLQVTDIVLAMGLAGFVNAAMLIMAATTFHHTGRVEVGTIEQAHQTLRPLLGWASSWVFAVSLLASGLSSSVVGTMAGGVVVQGFLNREIPALRRRLLTMLPAVVVIVLGLDPTRCLVLSQVVLSFGLPFAVIPLVSLTSRGEVMGEFANHRATRLAAWLAAGVIVGLNAFLVVRLWAG